MNPEWLRYYIAAKLNADVEDSTSIPTTSSRASTATWSASTSTSPAAAPASSPSASTARWPRRTFDRRRSKPLRRRPRTASRERLRGARVRQGAARDHALADRVNQYVDQRKPWELAKEPARRAALHAVCSTALALFRALTSTSSRCCRALAATVEQFLGIAPAAVAGCVEASARGTPDQRRIST